VYTDIIGGLFGGHKVSGAIQRRRAGILDREMQRIGKGAGAEQVEQGSGVLKKISFKRPHSALEHQTTAIGRQKIRGLVSEHRNSPRIPSDSDIHSATQIKPLTADAEGAREF
jgi:hypothetical protein